LEEIRDEIAKNRPRQFERRVEGACVLNIVDADSVASTATNSTRTFSAKQQREVQRDKRTANPKQEEEESLWKTLIGQPLAMKK
jgi:transcriptional regulator of nitric oxide reductase